MRKVLAILALLCAFAAPAAAVDYPQLDGRVIDEARLLSDGAKRTLENKLANLEAHASKQLIVVTLASARGMTVDDYGLALRKQWGLEVNGKRVMLIVGSTEGRSVIQYDTSLKGYLGEGVTERILEQTMKPRFSAGDFPGGVIDGSNALIAALIRATASLARRRTISARSASLLWSIICLLGEFAGLTLTLSGIVGIIVSIGVSLDSSVVYFENLKEDVRNGKTLTTDGPFAETKEQLLGFYVIDCDDLEEALGVARELAQANPGGAYEIRPLRLFVPGTLPEGAAAG